MNQSPHQAVIMLALAAASIGCGADTVLAQATSPPRDAPPTLDELLGLGKDREAAQPPPTDIMDKLTGEADQEGGVDIAVLFLEAVESMGRSATLLLDQRDAGLRTQRYQEEALLKLDTLIAQAQRQRQQQQQQQSQSNPRQAPPGQSQQQQDQQPGTDASRGVDNRPPLRQRDLDGAIDETGSEWGNLPPRVRDLLRQGRADAAARLYQRLTEIYYRRLAEEAQP